MKKRKTLVKRDGFWYGAGSIFNWTKDGHDIFGISVPRSYFKEKEIDVKVEGLSYTLNMDKAMEFVKKYGATKMMKFEKCGIVSRSLLEKKTKTQFEKDVEWFDNEL